MFVCCQLFMNCRPLRPSGEFFLIQEMLDQVARNRVRILADPDADVEECLKPVRQQHYKKKFVNRHSAKRL